ncbi:MAG: response regulator [Methylobacterium mesophilicum]|nr:response regulator [Methylobacterium mesophilicum]
MSDPSLKGTRILVVEDEYFLAQELVRMLVDEGATVVGPVALVSDALVLIDKEPSLDAAVLDINLGGDWSYPVAESLERRGIPFLFSTGYNESDLPSGWQHVRRVEKGMDDHLLVAGLGNILKIRA